MGRWWRITWPGSRSQTKDLAGEFLDITLPPGKVEKTNPVLAIVAPIMGGMMIMYAFLTGASTAQSILREDEERTLACLFTTPTDRSTILTGKFLAVFLTVLIQVVTLIVVSHLIFGIDWGAPLPVAFASRRHCVQRVFGGDFYQLTAQEHATGRHDLRRRADRHRNARHDPRLRHELPPAQSA